MNPYLISLLTTELALIIAGVILSSWVSFGLFTVIALCAMYYYSFERMKPEKIPDPDGAELLAALNTHRAEMQSAIDVMNAKIIMSKSSVQYGRRE